MKKFIPLFTIIFTAVFILTSQPRITDIDELRTFDLEYELYGGTNNPKNPNKYIEQ